MPTGFTADLADKNIPFPVWALRCARAFGPLISMRDEPMDAPIPDVFEPSTYSKSKLTELQGQLALVEAMTPAEAQAASDQDHANLVKTAQDMIERGKALQLKYNAMLTEVQAWTPPSKDHEPLKTFMIDQLMSSMGHDCDTLYWEKKAPKEAVKGETWRVIQTKRLTQEISYYEEEWAKEQDRCTHRTDWVRALKSSLSTSTDERPS